MPNTLAHIGAQGVATQALLRNVDPKWIYVGCIIPDFPWIVRRIILVVHPTINHHDITICAIIQASLLFCLLLSSAIALLTTHYLKTFTILGFNSFLHLFLDACETKWGNGVHFFAPFNWQLKNFGFFWPESILTYFLTISGLIYFVWYCRQTISTKLNIVWKLSGRFIVSLMILIGYFYGPFFILDAPEKADSHFIKTISSRNPGSYVEFDRAYYQKAPGGDLLRSDLTLFQVDGAVPNHSGTISVRANFANKGLINIIEYHEHNSRLRDISSLLGLTLVVVPGVVFFIRYFLRG